jgi:hypothetical protein
MPLPKDPIKAEASRKKMSESAKVRKRSPLSEVTRRKISESEKGKKVSEDTRKKISDAGKGKKQSPETIVKRVEKLRGKKHPPRSQEALVNYSESSKKTWENPEHRKHMSEVHTGKKQSPETIAKRVSKVKGQRRTPQLNCVICGNEIKEYREDRKTCSHRCRGIYISKFLLGDKSPGWMGGISFEPYCVKFNDEFKKRVRAYFNYTCVECHTPQNKEKLHVHHVNFNKMSCCDTTIPLFVPLCRSCHTKTNRKRDYWEKHFTEMIEKFYQGKCYFSKDEMAKYLDTEMI